MNRLKVIDEPRWISEAILLAIHARQIERYGGTHGVLDKNLVLSALARLRNRWVYETDSDYADLGADYLVGFVRSRGFNDGNKRTALACALVFLAINGFRLHVDPAELYALTMKAATKQADDSTISAYLRERLVPG